jgi:hypothetical protein
MRWGERDWYGSGSGLVLFRLVISPLYPEAVGPYPVRGAWLPSHLPVERAESYLDFVGHNWRPAVPEVQDPDNTPRSIS